MSRTDKVLEETDKVLEYFKKLRIQDTETTEIMDANTVQGLLNAAIQQAVQQTTATFQTSLKI